MSPEGLGGFNSDRTLKLEVLTATTVPLPQSLLAGRPGLTVNLSAPPSLSRNRPLHPMKIPCNLCVAVENFRWLIKKMFININPKGEHELDLGVQVCKPSFLGGREAGGCKFNACVDSECGFKPSLANLVRPCLNNERELQLQFMGGHLPPLHKIPGLISTESEAWWGMIFLRITLAEQPEATCERGWCKKPWAALLGI